ncbi:hypothetical protein ABFS83_08G159100 [Erythranthe nasuta]
MGKGRTPCCDKNKVKKGPWSPKEDQILTSFIHNNGHTNWRALPLQAGLLRCGKSCRLRWINYLRPDVKRGNFTPDEEQAIINLHNSIGNKWSKIASRFPGRTDNEIKNVWNTHLKKRVAKKNIAADNVNVNVNINIGFENTDKAILDHGFQLDSDVNYEKPEFLNVKSVSGHSPPTSSYASSSGFSNSNEGNTKANEALEHNSSNGKIEIPSEYSDVDLWELFDSLDELDNGRRGNLDSDPSNADVGTEGGNWIRSLENELGLTSDVDILPKEHNNFVLTQQQYE